MEAVPPSSTSSEDKHGRIVYMPHHGVLRKSSSTTKLRVVFNGSAPTTTDISLNSCLNTGYKLQTDLPLIILRWRCYFVTFCADIEKIYRQIIIHPDDRDLQCILWEVDGESREFRLATVTYGLVSTPFLALRTLRQLVQDHGAQFSVAAPIVRENMYVDDVLPGADSIEEARSAIQQVDGLLIAGGFRVQKWASSEADVLADLDTSRLAISSAHDIKVDTITCAFGLRWNSSMDRFEFRFELEPRPHRLTKRLMLSRAAQLFDPLGWVAPVIVIAKILIQQTWTLKIGWDDAVPSDIERAWTSFDDDLATVDEFSIPRWLGTMNDGPAVELHGFADASSAAMGAVVYLRTLNFDNTATVTLIYAKSKVASIKQMTIPRLELSAAVLLVRLIHLIQDVFSKWNPPVHLWTDSTVATTWIQGESARSKEFVANRVQLIRDLLPAGRWHHMPGEDNPTNYASRGMTSSRLHQLALWSRGPHWLSLPSTNWSSGMPTVEPGANLEERTPHVTAAFASRDVGDEWSLLKRFSRLSTLLRVTA